MRDIATRATKGALAVLAFWAFLAGIVLFPQATVGALLLIAIVVISGILFLGVSQL